MTEMRNDGQTPEERLGQRLSELTPAPPAWTRAAKEIPGMLQALDAVHAQVIEGAGARAVETAQLEQALQDAGVDPTPERVAALQQRLDERLGH